MTDFIHFIHANANEIDVLLLLELVKLQLVHSVITAVIIYLV